MYLSLQRPVTFDPKNGELMRSRGAFSFRRRKSSPVMITGKMTTARVMLVMLVVMLAGSWTVRAKAIHQETPDDVLTLEEEKEVFGGRFKRAPKHSIFYPRVTYGDASGPGGRHRRSIQVPANLQFNALGRDFDFKLEEVDDLFSYYFVFMERHGAEAEIQDFDEEEYRCFYRGQESEEQQQQQEDQECPPGRFCRHKRETPGGYDDGRWGGSRSGFSDYSTMEYGHAGAPQSGSGSGFSTGGFHNGQQGGNVPPSGNGFEQRGDFNNEANGHGFSPREHANPQSGFGSDSGGYDSRFIEGGFSGAGLSGGGGEARSGGHSGNGPYWEPNSNFSTNGRSQHPRATIAVQLCDNLRGIIKSDTHEYVLEPLSDKMARRRRRRRSAEFWENDLGPHLIYERETVITCSQEHATVVQSSNEDHKPLINSTRHRRSFGGERPDYRQGRRPYFEEEEHILDERLRKSGYQPDQSPPHHQTTGIPRTNVYIEIAVFVDSDLFNHMKENFPHKTKDQVIKVVLAMINAVQLLYNDPSLGHNVKFVLKRLEILHKDPEDLQRPYDIDLYLTNFCEWQRKVNPSSDLDPIHWDHALMLTGLDLYTDLELGEVNSQVVGLAPVAGMCTRMSSCTVNEARHFESVFVVTHEMGHNLGMRHDGLQAGNNCDPGRYLMSPTLGSGKITWSPCSKTYFDNFLLDRQSQCLRDPAEPHRDDLRHESKLLPGQRFSSDLQCKLKYGVGSSRAESQPLEDVCQDMHCRKQHFTWTSHPALEGTYCGLRKFCRRGICEDEYLSPNKPPSSSFSDYHSEDYEQSSSFSDSSFSDPRDFRDSAWWEPWSECNSSCLYGIDGILSSGSVGLSISKRHCRTCHSEFRYRACNMVTECGSGRRRTLQDYADETCTTEARADHFLTGMAVRIPQSGIASCQIVCEEMGEGRPRPLNRFFPDGTLCQSISSSRYPSYCISGKCTEFRCDPDALYGAEPLTCRPAFEEPDDYRPIGGDLAPSPSSVTPSFFGSSSSFSSPEWGPWSSASSCRFSCLGSSRGMQLVKRSCRGHGCTGINRNIQLCTPQDYDCGGPLRTPFEYASEVCGHYKHTVDQLSGVGMQLSATQDDPDRPCTVACQDVELKYRFYRVNGQDGWFPFGTDCSKGNEGRNAHCLNGRCLDFGHDNTPLRNTAFTSYQRSRNSHLDILKKRDVSSVNQEETERSRRDTEEEDEEEPRSRRTGRQLRRRDLKTNSHRVPGISDDSYLLSLVDALNNTIQTNDPKSPKGSSTVDLRNPLFARDFSDKKPDPSLSSKTSSSASDTIPYPSGTLKKTRLSSGAPDFGEVHSERAVSFNEELLPGPEDSKRYHWRLVTTPCSVTCGPDPGLKEVQAFCVSTDNSIDPVPESFCRTPKSVSTGFFPCYPQSRLCSQQISATLNDGFVEISAAASAPSPEVTYNGPMPMSFAKSPIGRWLMKIIASLENNGLKF
ncbi:uncharacterized protein LOC143032309 [Oratosquilla oratoria]|uniref:uncharacterized protein LOC143032309 n=1 Tax=Oratosquilla oratoria TaxID=337810 RepID=UPI003F76A97C